MDMRRSGRGTTPNNVVDLLRKAVEDTSQLDVSKKLEIGVASINRYINGVGEPTQETLEKLAAYFGVSVGYLRGETDYRDVMRSFDHEHPTDIFRSILKENEAFFLKYLGMHSESEQDGVIRRLEHSLGVYLNSIRQKNTAE